MSEVKSRWEELLDEMQLKLEEEHRLLQGQRFDEARVVNAAIVPYFKLIADEMGETREEFMGNAHVKFPQDAADSRAAFARCLEKMLHVNSLVGRNMEIHQRTREVIRSQN